MINVLFPEEVEQLLNEPYANKGLFVSFENGKWLAVDNTTSNVWLEDFESLDTAVEWVRDVDAPDKQVIYKVKFSDKLSVGLYTKNRALALAEYLSILTGCSTEIVEVIKQ